MVAVFTTIQTAFVRLKPIARFVTAGRDAVLLTLVALIPKTGIKSTISIPTTHVLVGAIGRIRGHAMVASIAPVPEIHVVVPN